MAHDHRIRTRFAIHNSMVAEEVLEIAYETLRDFELKSSATVPPESFVSVSRPWPRPCPVTAPEVVHWHDPEWEGEVCLCTSAADRTHHAEAVRGHRQSPQCIRICPLAARRARRDLASGLAIRASADAEWVRL